MTCRQLHHATGHDRPDHVPVQRKPYMSPSITTTKRCRSSDLNTKRCQARWKEPHFAIDAETDASFNRIRRIMGSLAGRPDGSRLHKVNPLRFAPGLPITLLSTQRYGYPPDRTPPSRAGRHRLTVALAVLQTATRGRRCWFRTAFALDLNPAYWQASAIDTHLLVDKRALQFQRRVSRI
jgi:hypothetical protein